MHRKKKKRDRRQKQRRMKQHAEEHLRQQVELSEYRPHIPAYKTQARKIARGEMWK